MKLAQSRSTTAVSRLPALVVLARLRMRREDPGVGDALAEATTLARATGGLRRLGPVAAAHAEAAWLQREEADIGFAKTVYAQALACGNTRFVSELGFWLGKFGESDEPQTHA